MRCKIVRVTYVTQYYENFFLSFIFCLNMKIDIIKRYLLLLCLYIKFIIVLDIYYDCVYIFGTIYYFY